MVLILQQTQWYSSTPSADLGWRLCRDFWLQVCIVPVTINTWQTNMAVLQPHDTHSLGALLDPSLKAL